MINHKKLIKMKTYKLKNALSLLSTKTLFLCMIGLLYTGCSKDEETLMDKVLTNVDNTTWLATYESESFELTFKDGQYTFTHQGNTSVSGTYSQNKTDIKFQEKKIITYTVLIIKDGKISPSGFMEIPMYYDQNFSDKDIAYTLKFTPIK